MAVEVVALDAPLGARIEGADLRHLKEGDDAARIRKALLDHQVLVFPGQKISADDQIRFCELFGRADSDYREPNTRDGEDDYRRGVMLVSNVRKNGKPIGSLPDGDMQFHSDGAHREMPYLATTLYGIRIPSRGGDTLFANLYAAYDRLDPAMKTRIRDLVVQNIYFQDATHREDFEEAEALRRRARHPIARPHDETGRIALFVSRLMSRHIVGLPEDEGDALLAELVAATEDPAIIYAHQWTPGDFLIWDNRCTNHARTDFPADEVRLLRRYTVSPAMAEA